MAGYHLPGDPYYPNHGNEGWVVEDPEEDTDEEPFEDSESSGTDTEPPVYNPPKAIPPPPVRKRYQGLPSVWGEHIHH